MITIRSASQAITRPALVMGYEWERPTRSVQHPLIGSVVPAVTVRPAGYPRGTLRLFYMDEETARAGESILAAGSVYSITDDDRPSLAMRFVVGDGAIRVQLDPQTLTRWTVEVPFQRVDSDLVFS